MKQVGRVDIPQEAFLAVLQVGQQVGDEIEFRFRGGAGHCRPGDGCRMGAGRPGPGRSSEGMRRLGQQEEAPRPWYVEYSRSFFPVILIVLVVRSFLVEPFRNSLRLR